MNTSVLILDGDHWQRETLAAALAYEGCHAEHTGDAASAMALLARHRFQLVLIDPSAPGTGGWQTLERLVLLYPELPVIFLLPLEGQPRSNLRTGANVIVGKPINFPALRSAIKRALFAPAETFIVHCIEEGALSPSHAFDALGVSTHRSFIPKPPHL